MIHRNGHVIAGARGRVEHRVGGVGAGDVVAVAAQRFDQVGDPVDLLVAHLATFARMGVEPGHGYARRGNAKPVAQIAGGDLDRVAQQIRGQSLGYVGERDVDRGRHDPELGSREHHHDTVDTGAVGKVFGMARMGEIRAVDQDLLVDRQGAERRGRTGLHQIHRPIQNRDDGRCVRRNRDTGGGGVGKGVRQYGERGGGARRRVREVRHFCPVGALGQMCGIADPGKGAAVAQRVPGLDGEFRPDARRVAAGDNQRPGHFWTIVALAVSWSR